MVTVPWIANVSEAHASGVLFPSEMVCISITNPGKEASLPGFKDILRLQFQDYDGAQKLPYGAVLFNLHQALQIASFARQHREYGHNILVHCAAGVSRSGAVVEALLEAFPEYEDAGWIRHPNGRVKSLMKRALGLVPIGTEREVDGSSEKAG